MTNKENANTNTSVKNDPPF